MGLLVKDAVRDFLISGHMPTNINVTKLVMLPKGNHPTNEYDFRPISCGNVIYKCISKLLCRLKELLPSLVHPSQYAFVKGRKILYNVLMCYDLTQGYLKKKVSPRCMLKVNLQKAFDSIHWEFLANLLKALKFPTVFTKWILTCIISVHFTIHINGQDQGTFKWGRGLKQGDPLSPLLFVLSMEYLSRALQQMSNNSRFHFHPSCKALKLTDVGLSKSNSHT